MDSPHCCLNWLAARSCNLRCRQRGQLSLTIEVTRDVCLLCIFPISNCTWILAPQHPDQLLLSLLLLSSWSAAAAAAVTWPCRTLFTWHLERCTRKACRYENIKRPYVRYLSILRILHAVYSMCLSMLSARLISPLLFYSACCLFCLPV